MALPRRIASHAVVALFMLAGCQGFAVALGAAKPDLFRVTLLGTGAPDAARRYASDNCTSRSDGSTPSS